MTTKVFLMGIIALACGVTSMTAQVGINTEKPKTTLDIVGDTAVASGGQHGQGFRLIDGNQAAGKVLTSDDDGVGSWQLAPLSLITGTWDNVDANVPVALTTAIILNSPSTYTGLSVTLPPGKYMMFVQVGYYVVPDRVIHLYIGVGTTQGGAYNEMNVYKFVGEELISSSYSTKTHYSVVKQVNFIVDLTAATGNTTLYINTSRQSQTYTTASGIIDAPTDLLINTNSDEFYVNAISVR